MRIGEGAFVWTNFPFGPPQRPDLPGPVPHIAYCLGAQRATQLVLAYTSSGRWRAGPRVPIGVIEFTPEEARTLHQQAFHLDLRVLARVPLCPAWFPYLNTTEGGIVARAGKPLRDRILRHATDLARLRPEVIEIRGPGAA